jgi:hypothetical protein|nr:MAG TPA: hypothetical protein [Caudoviricetes sp.]
MRASNFLEEAILNYFFRGQAVSRPTNLYLALYKTNPTDSDTGSEVTGGGYTRQVVSFNAPSQQGDRGTITNANTIEFSQATGDWGEFAYFGVRDAKDGGNLLVYGTFNKPQTVNEGTQFAIKQGDLSVSVA